MAAITDLLKQRILIIDGAMGTMIQAHKLQEADYRGKEFASHPRELRGCNDLLSITQPGIIEGIHRKYLEAGADIVETNTVNSTAISLPHYGLEHAAYDINLAARRVARRALDAAGGPGPARPRFVAGALGPGARGAATCREVT